MTTNEEQIVLEIFERDAVRGMGVPGSFPKPDAHIWWPVVNSQAILNTELARGLPGGSPAWERARSDAVVLGGLATKLWEVLLQIESPIA